MTDICGWGRVTWKIVVVLCLWSTYVKCRQPPVADLSKWPRKSFSFLLEI